MANARTSNVLIVDTTAQFDFTANICGIRYIAGTGSPSVVIKADSSSGITIYENADTASIFEDLDVNLKSSFHITISGTGTKAYLYLK